MLGLFHRTRTTKVAADEAGIDLATPIDEACYVVLDTELTGLDVKRDSIVSLGAIMMTGGRIVLGKTLERMVSPETALSSESVLVHGITPSECADKPSIGNVLEELESFCAGCVLVGHFLSLDLAVLNREFKRTFRRTLGNPAVDTWRIHDWVRRQTDLAARDFGDDAERDLFTLAKKHHIPVAKAHDALGDAFITAQLFQRFLRSLPSLGVRTLKELLKIGRP
ncbi:MAG TPA: 3'-5' exonuclease [Nitrospirota bacterium]|nr:3'-5' exonuclease [Nitrospirota bacterium]